jgi:hypothetical protein
MNYCSWIGILFCLLFADNMYAQEEEKERKWQLNGYVSDMVTFDWSTDSLHLDNLVHHRLNFKWFPTNNFNLYIDLRNRLFLGYTVKSIPQFGKAIDLNNDYLDLSVQFPKDQNYLFHSMLDRAYLEWYKNDWEIRLGRQRINWGVNLVWNPNDLFNAYSFFDFDYIERPGSDALRVKKYLSFASSFELAVNMADDFDELVLASMFRWNKWNYDFQFIGAKAKQDVTLGAAWAGNLKKAGFKGEATFFYPYKDKTQNEPLLMAVVSADYAFKNTLYLHLAVLYNSDGSDELGVIGFSNSDRLSARNLSPFIWSIFLQSTYQFHPLLTGGLATIYFPGKRNALFLNPNLSYSLKENLDLSLILQWYYDDILGKYEAFGRLVYVRAKWSF